MCANEYPPSPQSDFLTVRLRLVSISRHEAIANVNTKNFKIVT